MTLSTLKTGALAALTAFGLFGAPAAISTASAGEFETYSSRTIVRVGDGYDDQHIYLERRNGRDVPVILGDEPQYEPRRPRDGFSVTFGTRDPYRRHRERVRYCTTDDALDKAEEFGLYRLRVISAGERSIKIRGRKDGERVTIRFSRAPGCPIRSVY